MSRQVGLHFAFGVDKDAHAFILTSLVKTKVVKEKTASLRETHDMLNVNRTFEEIV